ncbi:murein biosynthesis integral membrane protein MurJ [Nocardioides piscis]|uniref:Murein biosynthesis integral membrane protein MurJ n=1 Tax=Nocardioides piscis TaxID=2714938 RepID=A0A6G7YDR3_9ACTN|nr:murein biosynthesis integral membrane protein MurJ [Nocardioides piscis]QIK74933.1 murein biosynthesis integral membrane protein MurJ [Nocardioides piscis]
MSDRSVLSSSAVMAAGTAFSRISGVLRAALLAAALGTVLRADMFAVANTLPNMIYILVAGGIFNAVLVPQLVRAMKNDPDGGDAYAQRVITLAAIFLALVTVVLIIATPWLLGLYLHDDFQAPDRAEHLQSITDLTRLCLPQVFFYGMFVLVGQILNSRERFGPMMWAPIANNAVAVAMLVTYLLVYGRAGLADERQPLGTGQELLLGIGSTLGIALQLVILLPYLRAVGFRFRPRFDFRDAGLARTLSLGVWTLLFVLVNQLAYFVVVKLASGGTVRDTDDGTGLMVYSSSFLIVMVPHSIVTVSLATAILPRLSAFAADHRHRDLGRTIASTLRTSLAIVLPFAALMPVVSADAANALLGWDLRPDTGERFAPTLSLFAVGLVFFTVHYLMLRAFYALEQTRRVFFIQCVIGAANIVGALVLVRLADERQTAPALAMAYLVAYVIGSAISYAVLRRTLGGLQTPALLRFVLRMLIVVAVAALVAWLVRLGVTALVGDAADDPHPLLSLVRGGLAGSIGLLVVLVLSRALRVREVTELVDAVSARLRPQRVLR